MSTPQVWANIFAYGLQIGLLVGLGALVPVILRLRVPRARLLYWQSLLAACLMLPWVRPWHEQVIAVSQVQVAASEVIAHIQPNNPERFVWPAVSDMLLWLLAAGVIARLGWLAIGMIKLARYRRHGRTIPMPPGWAGAAGRATLLVSDEVGGPVTFGFLRPVVLLPPTFQSLPADMQEAILFHELIHVERRDWLYTVGEEILRAVFWFHPAIWWVLGELQLAREQTVDQVVIDMTQARDPYVDALLAMAGATTQLDLAPAPLFLRRRHLRQRVFSVIYEIRISKMRLALTQIAAVGITGFACWFIAGTIPLMAQPRPIPPPRLAAETVAILTPEQEQIEVRRMLAENELMRQAGATAVPVRPAQAAAMSGSRESVRQRLMARLPIGISAPVSGETVSEAVNAFDPHLSAVPAYLPNGGADLRAAPAQAEPVILTSKPIRVGGNVMSANLVSQVRPAYPQLAKAARVQGTIRFEETIGKDGTVQDLKVVSGPPLLIQAAMEAVRQWVYKPTLLNSQPVEVQTTVDVSFTLADTASAATE